MNSKKWLKGSIAMIMASLVIASGATVVTAGVAEAANIEVNAASAYNTGMSIQNFKATGNLMVNSKIKFSADILNASTNYGVYTSAYITVTKNNKQYAQLNYNLNANEDTWVPTEEGTYTATLSVVDWYGQYATSSITLNVAKDNGQIRIENFTAAPAYTKITTTSPVKFSADFINAYTNYGVYTSAYIDITKDGVKHATLDFNNNNRQDTWTPSEQGTYTAKLYLTDWYGRYTTATTTFYADYNAVEVHIDNFKATSTSGYLCAKAPVKFSATISNATAQYGVYTSSYITITKDGKKYAELNYNLNTKQDTWTPTETGTYVATLSVVDGYGRYGKKSFAFKVNAALDETATLNKTNITLSQSVTATCTGKNGAGKYTYAFYYKKSTASSWTTVKGFSSTKSVSIKPTTAGTYTVMMKTKDANGTVVSKSVNCTVNAAVTNASTLSATSVKLGKAATATAVAKGGTGKYTYAFYYKKSTATSWTTLKGFSTTNKYAVKPTAAGSYNVLVKVKDSNGVTVNKTFNLTVTK